MKCALLTGGAGLLGSWLIRSLLTKGYEEIYAVARGTPMASAEERVFQTLRCHANGEIIRNAYERVKVIDGDIRKPQLGLNPKQIRSFLGKVTDIYHTAALADFRVPLNVIRTTNVLGTRHVLELGLKATNEGSRYLCVHHISTLFVAGNLNGWFGEEQLNCGQKFNNFYEQSKFEAEGIVQKFRRRGLRVTVYRPGIITGDSNTGVTTNFRMIYQPLHLLAFNLLREFPADEHTLHSLVPVDRVAEAICLLSEVDQSPKDAWQLVNPDEVSVGEFIRTASRVFSSHEPILIPWEHFPRNRLSQLQWELIDPFVPYFNYRLRFSANYTNHVLTSLGFRWPEMNKAMLTMLFRYCVRCWFVRSRRR